MKRSDRKRRQPLRRRETSVGEWFTALALGMEALDFLERSRELAAETVVASPAAGLPGAKRGARR